MKKIIAAIVIIIGLTAGIIIGINVFGDDSSSSSEQNSSQESDETSIDESNLSSDLPTDVTSDDDTADDLSSATDLSSQDISSQETSETTEATEETEETTKPTEATTKPTEATTKPTEATTKPTEATTKPTEATTKPTETTTSKTELIVPPYKNDPAFVKSTTTSYLMTKLSSSMATLVQELRTGILSQSASISTSTATIYQYEFSALVSLIANENPDIVSLGSTYNAMVNETTNVLTSISPTYIVSVSEAQTMQAQVENKVDEIVSKIKNGMTEFEVIKLFHDEIIQNCEYVETKNSSTAYGALVEGKAICEGYSKAFKLLCDRVGIQTLLCTGYGKNQEHMWNMVLAGGKWYHIDLTWDDPTAANRSADYVRYDYFMLTEAEIKKDHTRVDSLPFGISLPSATSTEMNYFNKMGLYAKSYAEAKEILKADITRAVLDGDGYARLRLSTSTVYNDTLAKLFDGDKEIFKILKEIKEETGVSFNANSYSKTSSDAFQTITIFIKY